ncbi:MAG: glycosyltransferase WbuB [Candidatus Xenobia bacterium]
MHLWILSHNFPPESNALAHRTFENAREWVKGGHSFDVLTDVPHFPEGRVYRGYANRFQHEETSEGISVYRVPILPAENRNVFRRTVSYVSYLLSLLLFSGRVERKPTAIFASTPQIFTALAGYLLSLRYRVPLVLEVRDLWPESISAVGAVSSAFLLRPVQWLADHLYRHARLIVVLTDAFRTVIAGRGIDPDKIVVSPPGVCSDWLEQAVTPEAVERLRAEHHLEGKFVVSYIGTIGMAHGVDLMLEAARRCKNPEVAFAVVGTGAARRDLEKELAERPCPNFYLFSKQPRELIPVWLGVTSLSLVLLKDKPVFETVIPSKLIEAMGAGKPVVLGIRGEAARLLRRAQAGVCFAPGQVDELVAAVEQLAGDPAALALYAENGHRYARRHHDRGVLAVELWKHLEQALAPVTEDESLSLPA